MTFDDEWVDEVRRGVVACKVFLWYPLYWLAYNQMMNNLVSQAGTMKLGKVPNDIISKLNPIFIIIVVPLMDFIIYPLLRKFNIRFTPIKKITAGFVMASLAMVSAAVTQSYIYKQSPCGSNINAMTKKKVDCSVDISVWIQVFPYGLVGMSEVLASITKLEYVSLSQSAAKIIQLTHSTDTLTPKLPRTCVPPSKVLRSSPPPSPPPSAKLL